MTVQTLVSGTARNLSLVLTRDRQLPSSKDALGVRGDKLIINLVTTLTLANSPSSLIRRINDHLSKATTVTTTSLRGQIAKVANRAKA